MVHLGGIRLLVRILLAAALVALVAGLAVSCNEPIEKPDTGCYYSVQADGNQYFVWIDNYDSKGDARGHYYANVGDSSAVRQNVLAHFSRNKVTVFSDKGIIKLKPSDVTMSKYEEPPYEEGNTNLFRKQFCGYNVTKDICYGKAEGYWTSLAGAEQDFFKVFSQGYFKSFKKHDVDLTLDLYKPEKAKGRRPLILFIHGGAFYIGSKDEPAYIDFCQHFASMGYVTASMNYRLGFHVSKNEIERAGYVALQDAHAALRYLVAHAKEYGIDPERIYVAGSSAGGITALNLAFMRDDNRPESTHGKKAFLRNKADLGDIESSGNDLKAKFKIIAVANMWGAVSDPDILKNGTTSIVSFHGESDNVVPYGEGYPLSGAGEGIAKLLSDKMYGSAVIDKKAGEAGLRHHFYSFPGESHAFNTDKNKQPNKNHTFIKEKICDFFFEEMMPSRAVIRDNGNGCYSVVGKRLSNIKWRAEGGFILPASQPGEIRVLWRSDEPHSLSASGTYGKDIDWVATL